MLKPDMSKKEQSAYKNARQAFDDLEVDEKARFMVEAVMSTFAEGIDRLTQVVNERFDAASNGDATGEDTVDGEAAAGGPTKAKSKSKSKTKAKSKSKKASGPDVA